jgi:two-component system, response regulator
MTKSLVDLKKTILLVEDNPDDVELTLRALRKNDILNEVAVARDGQEALDYVFSTGCYQGSANPVPSLILLDLKLPRIDGLEVLKRLRQDARTRLVPVVILSSSTEDSDLVRGYEYGANSYVHKPVDFSEFVEAARALGLYWLSLNMSAPCAGGNHKGEAMQMRSGKA